MGFLRPRIEPSTRRANAFILAHPLDFAWQVLKAFRSNQGLLLAGAVAYYALLSIVPFMMLVVVVLSHFIDQAELLVTLRRYLEYLVPGQSNSITVAASGSSVPVIVNQPGFVYFDPTQFAPQQRGFYGNLGRNTIIGPGLLSLDFSVMKNTRWGEGRNIQFRAEFFNSLNRPNFSQPSASIFDSAGRFVQNAGRITGTSGTPRQVQLALRVTF